MLSTVSALPALSARYAVLTRIAPTAVLPTHHAQRCLYVAVGVVTFSAFPDIEIPAVPAEILAGLSDVRDAPFPAKLFAVTEPVTFALPESQRFAHLFPVAPRSF